MYLYLLLTLQYNIISVYYYDVVYIVFHRVVFPANRRPSRQLFRDDQRRRRARGNSIIEIFSRKKGCRRISVHNNSILFYIV